LGWSAAQEKQLRGISGEYVKMIEDCSDYMAEAGKLTPEERQRHTPEFMRKNAEEQGKENKVRQQIADLLTPKQAAALREIDFRTAVPTALWHRGVQETVGITEEQKARLKRIADGSWESKISAGRAADEKTLAIFTPVQKQKLREELDRRGW
jgi:polyhydroxyalkanoate synthesis regulator phasin